MPNENGIKEGHTAEEASSPLLDKVNGKDISHKISSEQLQQEEEGDSSNSNEQQKLEQHHNTFTPGHQQEQEEGEGEEVSIMSSLKMVVPDDNAPTGSPTMTTTTTTPYQLQVDHYSATTMTEGSSVSPNSQQGGSGAASTTNRPGLFQTPSQRFGRMITTSLKNLTDALVAQIYPTSQKPPITFYVTPHDLSTLASERTVGSLATLLDIARKGEQEASTKTSSYGTTGVPGGGAGLGGQDDLESNNTSKRRMMNIDDALDTTETPTEMHKICMNLQALVSKIRTLDGALNNTTNDKGTADSTSTRQRTNWQYQLDVAQETAANALTSLVLKSSPETGLDLKANPTQLTQRAEVFGLNAIAPKKLTTFWEFCWDALQDFVLIMLICLGVVSIIVETTIGDHADHCTTCWVEGAAILVAVCIVVLVTATIDYQKQKTFVKLSKTLDDTNTKTVIRNGEMLSVVDADIVVGDILSVNSHNLATIPADCVLLGPSSGGAQLKVDESSLTGESKLVSKKPGDVILSGTTAVQGSGKMVVIAVGIHSVAGKIKARVYEAKAATATSASEDEDDTKKKKKDNDEDDMEGDDETPLFAKLTVLAKQIGIAGTIAACIAFVASLILGLAVKGDPPSKIVEYFIVAVTVLAVAVPEGLPLAVTLALAFSSSKMTSEQNLVKHLDACETMGCATTICTDKTGTLTANKMTARAIMIGDGKTVSIIHNDPSTTLADEMLRGEKDSTDGGIIPTSILYLLTKLISIATMNETVLHYGKSTDVDKSHVKSHEDKNKKSAENANGQSNIANENGTASGNKHEDDLVITGSEGNPTECALLHLVDDLGYRYSTLRNETRGRSDVGDLGRFLGEGKQFDFTSARKMMSWAVPKVDPSTNQKLMGSDGGYQIYSKGAAEVIASRCTKMLVIPSSSSSNDFDRANKEEEGFESTSSYDVVDMTPEMLSMLNKTSEKYARRGMRCLSLAFRDLPISASSDWEALSDDVENSDGSKAFEAETQLTFVALVGIEDPLRKEVPHAIQQCYEAGIDVRMVTGDNPNTAVSIAHQAGILREEHFIVAEGDEHPEYIAANLKPNVMLEGKEFRERVYRSPSSSNSMIAANNKKEFDQTEFDRIWPHLRVLARSSPDDKLTLAHGLNQSTLFTDKQKCKVLLQEDNIRIFPDRQVVAMTGDGTNDAPALKRADIGFAMGLSGTQIAKDAADIILLDDNFASIVTAAKWGRNVYASIQKFLQFQLTVNIAAVTTALVGAFAFQTSPLAAIQLLWVNLLMDSLASLALASEPPTEELLKKPPVNRSDAMITKRMWANMIGHAIYQIVVVLTLLFDAPRWFGITPGYASSENTVHFTLIFNSFVWMQLFNEINCRNLKGEHNVFKGVFRNPLFCGVWITTAFLQVIIVQFGSVAMSVAEGGLNGRYWGISLAFGVGSFPIQQVINIIYRLVQKYKIVRDRKRLNKASHMLRQNISQEHM